MATEGMCLVVSPLIALMKDQVENLRKKNITAYAIHSGMNRKEVLNVMKVVTESNCKFLYVSPERLETRIFREFLPGMGISLLAVDEAHCISQWGYDFRPSYLRINSLREELPGIPVLALTASATPGVQHDICEKLGFNPVLSKNTTAENTVTSSANWNIYRQSFERPNLSYSVFRIDSRINKILEILGKVQGTAIIYCKSRKRTREISELVQMHGISSDHYHAGLTQEDRSRKQEEWISGKTRVMVCTNAFGMGIDKPDVRVVIHADVPDCLENYYQEAGRAGRDGKTSFAVLLYHDTDLASLEEMASLRFPSITQVRTVYQAVSNYLQIPVGGGEGEYFDFDITDFLRKFKLNSHTTLYSLKALEQEGWISFNEQVFLPSFVHFTTSKEYLHEFENKYPAYEPLIKTLLRSYEGIFDQQTGISEKLIASLLKTNDEVVKEKLAAIDRAGVIEYQAQKDAPQLYLVRARVKADELGFDMAAYNTRKKQFLDRVGQMKLYIHERSACRSSIIGNYFGDPAVRDCGVCDNCLSRKNTRLSKEEFDTLHHRILNMVKYESLHTTELIQKLGSTKKENAWKVIEFLQSENKLDVDKAGWVRLK